MALRDESASPLLQGPQVWLLGGGRGRGEAVCSLEAEESRTLLQGARPLEVAEIGNRLVWSRVVGRKRRYKEREKEKEKRKGKSKARLGLGKL